VKEHHITVMKTARYVTLGEASENVTQVGFVCHGYRQSAASFIMPFAALDDGSRLVVAPEGLSRFYIDDAEGEHGPQHRVGASWMTRDDRENEISDYVNYLDVLYARIFKTVNRGRASVFALGFSQGTATVCRWVAQGTITVDHLILWGGGVPPDLDLAAKKSLLKRLKLTLVTGRDDKHIPMQRVEKEIERLGQFGITPELAPFDGGHHLDEGVLRTILGG
jgi:predicted esterase